MTTVLGRAGTPISAVDIHALLSEQLQQVQQSPTFMEDARVNTQLESSTNARDGRTTPGNYSTNFTTSM